MKKKVSTLIACILIAGSVCGQTDKVLAKAFRMSYTHEADSNYTAAITSMETVYRQESYELNLRLGWLHYLKGDYPQSILFYNTSRELLPYSVEAMLGYVLPTAAVGNWDEVVEVYQEILKIDPQNTLVNYRMGVIYYERQHYEQAYYYAEKVVNLYPFDFDSVILLAQVELKKGRYREAKVLFNKALLIYPDNPTALKGLDSIK